MYAIAGLQYLHGDSPDVLLCAVIKEALGMGMEIPLPSTSCIDGEGGQHFFNGCAHLSISPYPLRLADPASSWEGDADELTTTVI